MFEMIHESFAELKKFVIKLNTENNGLDCLDKDYPAGSNDKIHPIKDDNKMLSLAGRLYSECYATKRAYRNKGSGGPARDLRKTENYKVDRQQFVSSLSHYNHTTEYYFEDWRIRKIIAPGQIVVNKFGCDKTLNEGQYEIYSKPGLAEGNLVSFKTRKENNNLQEDFHYIFSSELFEYSPTIIRLYWNVGPENVGVLIDLITRRLNAYRIPFLFKCLNHPDLYKRRDCCVLYVNNRYISVLKEILPGIHSELETSIYNDVPLFTFRIFNGLGFSESPINGDSFGMSRMKIVAKALIHSICNRERRTINPMEAVFAEFASQNISIEAPYLNAGTKAIVQWT
jgi:hypothetical protein